MSAPDITAIAKSLKPVKGGRLAVWLQRFLSATPDQLSGWKGTFTEVTTAKAVEIYRRRGVIDEHEAQQARFKMLTTAIYRLEPYKPEQNEPAEN
ncbi:hypothetical protein A3H16_04095 [Candidatus Kaiserbacteria bacterium RIFCSPLOWO2_12_FULL_53_8]|uniref:Uncharacterized protein n=2 Tax=Candidatus Kaiseribacteriota TaxID=1752734 RepID=A0A1F6CTM7_9BACT|nr:MAG: hypothetical protein A2851_05525 [Candidatus Kaiserbacteria bacterium RIFCSPHIGHO2_01_FULL_53_29]OGG92400.1 MAG: hypothetical protein A3H16_04095 [Candidatus Kaiserbacteria bacterium RIFCSPLOWO2_12_FULL_53_8]